MSASVCPICSAARPPAWWDLHAEEAYVDALTPLPVFYNDVSTDVAESCAARLSHQSLAGSQAPLTDAAWRHMPTTYVVCDKDCAIPPSIQEQMAEHAVRVHHLPSGHSPSLIAEFMKVAHFVDRADDCCEDPVHPPCGKLPPGRQSLDGFAAESHHLERFPRPR